MKYLLFVLFISISSVQAQELDCENKDPAHQLLSMASGLALPNCVNEANLSAAKSNDISKLCGECKPLFERNDSTFKTLSKEERQSIFVEAAIKEFKKNITNNLVDALKLRSLRPTGSDFKDSNSACKMKQLPKNCSASALKIIGDKKLLSNLDKEVSNELAKLISTDQSFAPEPTLLKRSAPQCYIPEKNALYISSSATEEAFSPEIIKALLSLDPSKFRSTTSMFLNDKVSDLYSGEIDELFEYLKNHPLMGDNFKSPQSLITFLKSIPEPKDVTQLRKAIYNKKNGDAFDSKLASSCKTSYDALIENICSTDFEKGNFSLSAFSNQEKLQIQEFQSAKEELASNDQLIKLNHDVLKLCDPSPNSKISFSKFSSDINAGLKEKYQVQPLEQFKMEKFDTDIGNMNKTICGDLNRDCSKDNSIVCKMISKFNALKDTKSLDYKLANSSNEEVNKLLRSMIGDTSRIDVETKKILIAQGIIPKDDGSMVKQPDIPERQPEFFAKEQSQQPGQQQANTNVAKIGPSSSNSKAANNRAPANDNTYDDSYSNVNSKSTTSQSTGPDFSDLMDNQQELKNVQDEIKRRLLGSNGKPSEEEARKVVRDSFKSRKQPLSQEMEDAFTNRIMDNNATTPQAFANNSQTTTTDEPNRAQVSGGDSANAKWRKQQDQNALMGMAGAQQVLGKDSANSGAANADAKPKDLTKVALNLADDPRVNLSELFNKKIDQNDSETQLLKVLLRNKNNFLLQVKAMNFKVVFDEKNNFNVLLESGDKQEAARIRPQLEMFLKKLKS